MSEININGEESLRVTSDHSGENFIGIRTAGYRSLQIGMIASLHYIEVRKKEGLLNTYVFPKKSYKKDYDFKWWADAEVVFSNNDVIHDTP